MQRFVNGVMVGVLGALAGVWLHRELQVRQVWKQAVLDASFLDDMPWSTVPTVGWDDDDDDEEYEDAE